MIRADIYQVVPRPAQHRPPSPDPHGNLEAGATIIVPPFYRRANEGTMRHHVRPGRRTVGKSRARDRPAAHPTITSSTPAPQLGGCPTQGIRGRRLCGEEGSPRPPIHNTQAVRETEAQRSGP